MPEAFPKLQRRTSATQEKKKEKKEKKEKKDKTAKQKTSNKPKKEKNLSSEVVVVKDSPEDLMDVDV